MIFAMDGTEICERDAQWVITMLVGQKKQPRETNVSEGQKACKFEDHRIWINFTCKEICITSYVIEMLEKFG